MREKSNNTTMYLEAVMQQRHTALNTHPSISPLAGSEYCFTVTKGKSHIPQSSSITPKYFGTFQSERNKERGDL